MVVVVIITILVGLLLPAIQSAREAARRNACLNTHRQVALAVTSYESQNGALPPGGFVAPAESECRINTLHFDPRSGPQMSWIVGLLPFMEEQALWNMIDPQFPITQQLGEPQSMMIGSLLCASDRSGSRGFVYEGKTFGKCNIAGFAGPYRLETMSSWAGALGGFRPGSRRGQSTAQILDGLSKTLLASEVRTRSDDGDQRGAWALPWAGASLLALNLPTAKPFDADTNLDDVSYAPSSDAADLTGVQIPNKVSGELFDRLYRCDQAAAAAEGMPCTFTPDGLGLYASPRSLHPGGVNAVALDGHAAFISDDMDPIVMARLVAVADGQLNQRTADDE
jgi:prepilin-type processing-associated H-X9-DG protein